MPTPLPDPADLVETPPPAALAAADPAPLSSRTDAALAARAVRERWPIAEDRPRRIAERLAELATDPERSDRTAIAAARVLCQLDGLNLDAERHADGETVNVNLGGPAVDLAAAQLAEWRARQQEEIRAFLEAGPTRAG